MMKKRNYTQYVHEFETTSGKTRYAVAQWDENHAKYIRPFDRGERRDTGCNAEFARTPNGVQSFPTKRQALARARYLFAPESWE
jgi:hypothetical protein